MVESVQWREYLSDAIRYWEPRRWLYNLILAVVVLVHFISGWPGSRQALQLNGILLLFALAVLANVAYCAAYVADIFVQMSGFREVWLKFRWALLAVGVSFAAVLTHFFAFGIFGESELFLPAKVKGQPGAPQGCPDKPSRLEGRSAVRVAG